MWITFTSRASRIFKDRTAFYYQPGNTFDLPPEWAMQHIAAGEAREADAPMAPVPAQPFVPPSMGDDMLTVACVWKTGGSYTTPEYVEKLASMVARHLVTAHRFVCLTDHDQPIAGAETIPLQHGWPGFWSKVELYRPGLWSGPVLYIDLDTIICGDIDAIAETPGNVVALWDLQHGWLNSSFLLWRVDLSCVYDAMLADPAGVMQQYETGDLWGDQGLLQATLSRRSIPWTWVQEAHPDALWWHPNAMRTLPAPDGVRVALWYGHPKPHEIRSAWVLEHWR